MRFRLVLWLLFFVLGMFMGDRYGLPGWARSAADGGFSAIGAWLGKLDEPIPESGGETEHQTSDAEPSASDPAPPAPQPASDDQGATATSELRINDAGLQIIKDSEGLRLEAYEAGGEWLIGYGHRRTAQAGMTITEQEAEQLLREDVRASEDTVRRLVTVPVNENQFSAMVSLAYNLGESGFSRTAVLERINAGDYDGAADGFLVHDRMRVNGELQSVPHLTERRQKERDLFLTPA
ncbi:lysozyme [Hyphococcus sp.]|uniref:lysozyme n=1 Tax=Hyphococcus sp. TaxID=2038636 RepID=UPI0035C75D37